VLPFALRLDELGSYLLIDQETILSKIIVILAVFDGHQSHHRSLIVVDLSGEKSQTLAKKF
jgi:hypothetical protein